MASFKRTTACLLIAMSLWGTTATAADDRAQEISVQESYDKGWKGIIVNGVENHWAKQLFQWGVSQHIINGYPDQSVKPDQAVTEAEFLKMLYRGMGMVLPGASDVYDRSQNWAEGPYRMSKYLNHPTAGLNNLSKRFKPITKQGAAEIISASQGVNFTGRDAIVYLIGNGLANSEASSPEQFDGERTFSRAEALQWIRQLAIHSKLQMGDRPEEPTDRSLLPALPTTPIVRTPDFSAERVTQEDFDLPANGDFPGISYGEPKRDVEVRFGASGDQDIFDFDTYPLFDAHFTSAGLLDCWKVDSDTLELPATADSLRTQKGIILGKSTLTDIVRQYGSTGVLGRGILTYYYEKQADGTYRNVSIYDSIRNTELVSVLTFIVDDVTQVVFHISVYPFEHAFRDRDF